MFHSLPGRQAIYTPLDVTEEELGPRYVDSPGRNISNDDREVFEKQDLVPFDTKKRNSSFRHLLSNPRLAAWSFVRQAYDTLSPTTLTEKPVPQHGPSSTAFLDGMRGIAALFVFNQHTLQEWYKGVYSTYGLPERDGVPAQNNITSLPGLRLTYAGAAMVLVFFVVSGYALSLAPLRRRGDPAKMLMSVSSSVFRRFFRLYIPTITVSLIFALCIYVGLLESARPYWNTLPVIKDRMPDRFDTIFGQLRDLWYGVLPLISAFNFSVYFPTYDSHQWTIGAEFRGSLALYLVIAMTCRMKTHLRLAFLVALMWYVNLYGRWAIFAFLLGNFICDIDTLRRVHSKDTEDMTGRPLRARLARHAFWITMTLCALYILSMPQWAAEDTPGYRTMDYLIPDVYKDQGITVRCSFWWAFGAAQLVWTGANYKPVRRAFDNCVSRYLGNISFALYLLHGPLLHLCGIRVAEFVSTRVYGVDKASDLTQQQVYGVFAAEYLATALVLFPLSHLVWKTVDVPAVKFAKWMQEKSFDS